MWSFGVAHPGERRRAFSHDRRHDLRCGDRSPQSCGTPGNRSRRGKKNAPGGRLRQAGPLPEVQHVPREAEGQLIQPGTLLLPIGSNRVSAEHGSVQVLVSHKYSREGTAAAAHRLAIPAAADLAQPRQRQATGAARGFVESEGWAHRRAVSGNHRPSPARRLSSHRARSIYPPSLYRP